MKMYRKGLDLIRLSKEKGWPIWKIAVETEIIDNDTTEEEIFSKMQEVVKVMENSSKASVEKKNITLGGIIGGEANKLNQRLKEGETLCGDTINKAMIRAFSTSEYNASMGKICAAPTAGASGIIPAALLTVKEKYELDDITLERGLLTASAVGKIISTNATVAGAEGGCQAECGSAAAMASAAIVEMLGGTPEMSLNASAIALKNIMGLICDPVAGLVESPCSKRNSSGVVNAMTSAELALAGIESVIPFDEVVEAMKKVGDDMHSDFKETARGGIAGTPTGIKFKEKIKNI